MEKIKGEHFTIYGARRMPGGQTTNGVTSVILLLLVVVSITIQPVTAVAATSGLAESSADGPVEATADVDSQVSREASGSFGRVTNASAAPGSISSTASSDASITIKIENPGPTHESRGLVIPANETLRENQDPKFGPEVTYSGLSAGSYTFSVYEATGTPLGFTRIAWWGNITVSVDTGQTKTVTFERYTPWVNNTVVLPKAPRDDAGDPRFHFSLQDSDITLIAEVHNPDNVQRTVDLTFTGETDPFPHSLDNVVVEAGSTTTLKSHLSLGLFQLGRHYETGVRLSAEYDGSEKLTDQTKGQTVFQEFWVHNKMIDFRNHNWAYNGSAPASLHGEWLNKQGLDGTNVTVALLVTGVDTSNPAINRVYKSGTDWTEGKLNIVHKHNPDLVHGGIKDEPGTLKGYHGMSVSTMVWQFAPNASYIVIKSEGPSDHEWAIDHLRNKHDVDVIITSNTFGGETLARKFSDAVDADTSVVVAAGNLNAGKSGNLYPATLSTGEGVLSIASTNRDRSICRSASPGNSTDINGDLVPDKPNFAVPGCELIGIGEPRFSGGSSWAAPNTAGVLALLTERARAHGLRAINVRHQLKLTAIPTATWNGSIDADNNGSIVDDDIDGAGAIKPIGAYYELVANDELPNANISVTQVNASDSTVTVRVTLNNTGAAAGSGSGVHLAVKNGSFTSVDLGGFSASANTTAAGFDILELYTPVGNVTSGNITIELTQGSTVDLLYRGWLFDPHDAVYNPHRGRYERYVARDPAETRYAYSEARLAFVPASDGTRLIEGQRPLGNGSNPPYNRHTGDQTFGITNYSSNTTTLVTTDFNKGFTVSPDEPVITPKEEMDVSHPVLYAEQVTFTAKDPEGQITDFSWVFYGEKLVAPVRKSGQQVTLDPKVAADIPAELTVTYEDGSTETFSRIIAVQINSNPVNDITLGTANPALGDRIVLNGSRTYDGADSVNDNVTRYQWFVTPTKGLGSELGLGLAAGRNTSYRFSGFVAASTEQVNRTITLETEDEYKAINRTQRKVTLSVPDDLPVLTISNATVGVNRTVDVPVLLSKAPDGVGEVDIRVATSAPANLSIVDLHSKATYSWYSVSRINILDTGGFFSDVFEPGDTFITLFTVEIEGDAAGQVVLNVSWLNKFEDDESDNFAGVIKKGHITVTQPPTVKIDASPSTHQLRVGGTVDLSVGASTDDGSITNIIWLVDGQRYEGTTHQTSFTNPGLHTVSVNVTDNHGVVTTRWPSFAVLRNATWPMASYGPQKTYANPNTAGPKAPSQNEQLGTRWSFRNRSAQAETQPVVSGDSVYVGYDADEGGGTIYAFNRTSGDKRWQISFAESVEFAPVVIGDTVYVAAGDTVYALDEALGELRWSTSIGSTISTPPTFWNGRLYLGTWDGDVVAISIKEKAGTAGMVTLNRTVTSGRVVAGPVILNGTVAISNGSTTVAIDAMNGSTLWESPVGTVSLAAGGSYILESSGVLGNEVTIYSMDAHMGSVEWKTHYNATFSGMLFANQTIYTELVHSAGGEPGVLVGLDPATGEEVSNYSLPALASGEMSVAGRMLYFGSPPVGDGITVAAVNLTTGQTAWTDDTGSTVVGVTASKGDAYISDLGGLVQAYTIEPSTSCIGGAVAGRDATISLTEIQTAINWWAEDTVVPDTGGQTISLTKIQTLINAWAEGQLVSC